MKVLDFFLRFPLLTTLFVVQTVTLGLGVLAAMTILISANRNQNDAAFLRARESVLPILSNTQEKWRALHHLEMNDALNELKAGLLKQFPVEQISVLKRSDAQPKWDQTSHSFIVPEKPDDTLDTVVFVSLDKNKVLKQYGGSSLPLGLPLALVISLIFTLIFSTLFIHRYFIIPLQTLATTLSNPISQADHAVINNFSARGEVKLFVDRIEKLYLENRSAQKSAAVAELTQMLAHDIRKPFTMLSLVLDAIQSSQSTDDIRMVTKEFLPEIKRAISSVNGLLRDVMEASSKAVPVLEPTKPEALIRNSLVDIFSIKKNVDINFSYQLDHSTNVLADSEKLLRVFSNITNNAVQSMRGKGLIQFKTRNVRYHDTDFVQFSIFNSGSFVPKDDLPHLFDAFFTKGKKGGTGLGLAIAQKIVSAHGGSICCISEKNDACPDGFAEFVFTIPAGLEVSVFEDISLMPLHSSELLSRVVNYKGHEIEVDSESIGLLEGNVLSKLSVLDRKVKILVIDDESIYRNSIKSHLDRCSGFENHVELTFVDGSSKIPTSAVDGAIIDVDLGTESLDGFEIATNLREKYPESFLCIHSNRTFANDHKRSLEAGADAFLPKSMTRGHFVRFLAQVLNRLSAVDVTFERL